MQKSSRVEKYVVQCSVQGVKHRAAMLHCTCVYYTCVYYTSVYYTSVYYTSVYYRDCSP